MKALPISATLLACLIAWTACSSDSPSGSAGAAGSGGSGSSDAGADAPADVETDSSAEGGPDLSSIDPAKCPTYRVEDLRGFSPSQPLTSSSSLIQDKAFYLFTAIEAQSARSDALKDDSALTALAARRADAMSASLESCGDASCWGDAFKWSASDIESVSSALLALLVDADVAGLVSDDLRPSGTSILQAGGTDGELLVSAWERAAAGLNEVWDDYATSIPEATLKPLLESAVATAPAQPFYAPLVGLVPKLLEANGRPEPTRYEPLTDGENQAAIARIPNIDFSKYPFSVIVVPGQGPTDLEHPLDPRGAVRADQAAARYAAGLAPLIALSGGHVHPDRTPYSEAIEMKRYLMQQHSLPEDVLLVDPHARHTTTNLRNVARLMFRYGIPTDKPSLITSDLFQTAYISAAGADSIYGKRCLEELGFMPYQGLTNLDTLDNCWLPSVDSMQQDARDLLDP
ncbi:MAG: YdcF family protein [Myxococcales bacterium]|nr:YdcF family protein [Myxococcales bacterium]